MKIAFVDNLPVGGGLSRYSLGLCKNLILHDPDLFIDYYIHDDNVKRMSELFCIKRLSVIVLASTKKEITGGGAFHEKKASNNKDYNYSAGTKAKMSNKKKH